MKRVSYFLLILTAITLLITSCKKDDPVEIRDAEILGSISESTIAGIDVNKGEIGIEIDLRKLVFFGYKPEKVQVDFNNDLSSYSTTLDINKYTSVATLKIPVDGLPESILKKFDDGVSFSIKVLDENGAVLEDINQGVTRIYSSSERIVCDTQKPKILYPLVFNPKNQHFIQIDLTDGKVLDVTGAYTTETWIIGYRFNDKAVSSNQDFYIINLDNDSTFAIKAAHSNLFLKVKDNGNLYQDKITDINQLQDKNKFIFHQEQDGWVKIRPLTKNSYLKFGKAIHNVTIIGVVVPEIKISISTNVISANAPDKFRIIASDIDWEFTDNGTESGDPPIVPGANLNFAYRATIKNCSSAQLSETVGKETKKISKYKFGWGEKNILYSSKTSSTSFTAKTSVSGTILGVGVDASFEGTMKDSHTSSETNENSSFTDIVDENHEIFSRTRQVNLGPYIAIETYDAILEYKNISMPYIQKISVRGTDRQTGKDLTDKEIITQIMMNNFTGVVLNSDSKSVSYSIRGTFTVDNVYHSTTDVVDIEGACN